MDNDHARALVPEAGQLYGAPAVAAMLGIGHATLREHVRSGATWIPAPVGKVSGAWVWRGEDIDLDAAAAARPSIGRPKGAKDLRPRVRAARTAVHADHQHD